MPRPHLRKIATPFVTTISLLPACVINQAPAASETSVVQTPSQAGSHVTAHSTAPQPTDTGAPSAASPPPSLPPAASASAGPAASATSPAIAVTAVRVTPTASADPSLPQAPPGGRVDRRSDGSCWHMTEAKCPPGATCNPPPPRRVACPR